MTDIVGSTRLWAEHESAMAVDLVSHDEMVSDAIVSAGGRVFKHTGDGAMATFDSATASAEAAAEIQRAIGGHVWQVPDGIRVRVALHSGSVHERDGDLFGPPVNRLARLLSRCSPGAVIVSEATASLLADGIPDGLGLREIGRVELRDVGRSEAVHCLVGDDLESVEVYEAVVPAGRPVGLLPPIDDDLVGRTGEIGAVLDAIGAHPVVSIVGVGGMGKTRLALESASVAGLPDGAWWCDLTAATSPEAVPATVLAAIGASQSSGRTALESIVVNLADRYALVVLDNCEHVVDAARAVVGAIRAGCDKVRVLATSREALGLRGEHVISLSSLPAADSIGLFCTRAVEARSDLVFDDATLAAIGEICVRLDGIPLAIELAAARCRSLAPAEIAARLDDRFRLLRGGRGGVERHRTLQAAVEWSYSLLDDNERALFDRMAVFAAGALIDAVAAVGDVDEYDALDILDRLIARSMVVATDTALGTRYRQLETLRQFAEDRLVEHGVVDEVRDRHLEWACTLAAWFDECAVTRAEVEAFRRYCVEIDNLRASVHYAIRTDRYQKACEVIAGIGYNAIYRPTFEVADWCDPARVPAPQWTSEVASTAGLSAELDLFAGNEARVTRLLGVVPEVHQHNLIVLGAATLQSVFAGDFDLAESRLAAVGPADRAFSRAQIFHNRLHTDRATDAEYRQVALAHCEQLVAHVRARGAPLTLAVALDAYARCLDGAGDIKGAVAVGSDAIELAEKHGAWFMVDNARAGLVYSLAQLAASEPDQRHDSVATLRATLEAAITRRNHFVIADCLSCPVERVLWDAGDHRTAALLGKFGKLHVRLNELYPSAVDPALLGTDALAEIEAEVAKLDIGTAGAIALAALDHILVTD
ncbi:MAG: NB-ARC domain-containing protein [Ilumatobacteraceae bacterium]